MRCEGGFRIDVSYVTGLKLDGRITKPDPLRKKFKAKYQCKQQISAIRFVLLYFVSDSDLESNSALQRELVLVNERNPGWGKGEVTGI